MSRPRNSSSLVYFRPGEKYANCTVEIVNDNLNEPQELFLVELSKTVGGYAYVDYSSSPVCVLIEHDKNDRKCITNSVGISNYGTPQHH